MTRSVMIAFLNGAVAFAYLVAAVYFLRFWRKTRDRFFLGFATAFFLFTLNLGIATLLGVEDERTGYSYALRVLGFLLILVAILEKNLRRPRQT